MTDKQLHRLKRPELIEILYYLRKELDDVKNENERLKKRLDILTTEALSSAYGARVRELLDKQESEEKALAEAAEAEGSEDDTDGGEKT